jgi:hypothetical protein
MSRPVAERAGTAGLPDESALAWYEASKAAQLAEVVQ